MEYQLSHAPVIQVSLGSHWQSSGDPQTFKPVIFQELTGWPYRVIARDALPVDFLTPESLVTLIENSVGLELPSFTIFV